MLRLPRRILAATILVLASCALAPGAIASEADFKLVNRTGYRVDNVYVSPASAKSWGRDILGRDTLDDGETVTVTFPHTSSACRFDIKVKYHDGDTAEWGNVDLCQYEQITIYWDGTNTRAVGE